MIVDFTCPAGQVSNCQGTILLNTGTGGRRAARASAATTTVGSGAFDIAPGRTDRVTVKLTSAGTELLGRKRSLPVTIVARTLDGSGRPVDTRLGALVVHAGARLRPALHVATTPKRDRTFPYRFVTTGRLALPKGTVGSVACRSSSVVIRFKVGRKTISTRRARVSSKTCRFRRTVTFHVPSRLHGHHALRVVVRYGGSATLGPVRKAVIHKVHAG